MGVTRTILRLVVATVGFLGGCFWKDPVYRAAYGIEPPPHDPAVLLTDFSYTPAGPVKPGDTLTFTVTANKLTARYSGDVAVLLGAPGQPLAGVTEGLVWQQCNDYGQVPDETSGDGIFTGSMTLPVSVIPQQDVPVTAFLHWYDGALPFELPGEPLEIVEGD